MKKLFIASAITSALSLGLISTSAFADAKHEQGKEEEAAAGRPGDLKKISRSIQVSMSDNMRYTPSRISVKRGETVKFVIKNTGKIKHEMVIGSVAELKEHAELMRKFPDMEHAEPNQLTLDPGKSGVLVWQFTKAGTVDFACLQPGHFEAGMVGKVKVAAK